MIAGLLTTAPGAAPVEPTEARARRYHRVQLAVHALDLGLTAAVLVAWLATGAAAALVGWLEGFRPAGAVPPTLALAVGGSATLLTLPLDLVAGLILPRRAGLSVQSAGAWLADRGKALGLGALLALLATTAVYALARWSPRLWWLLAATVLEAGAVVLAALVPVWLAPLFYRLAPLDDPEVRRRLLALGARAGVPAVEVLVADFSRRGRTANAAVVGLGRTRRIVVSDTLLRDFPLDEVEVILAHELAHHARGHVARSLALQGAVLLVILWAADQALRAWGPAVGLTGPGDPAGLPLLALVVTGLGLLATPVIAAWSRRLEREADRAALLQTRTPDAFVSAMERLGRPQPGRAPPGAAPPASPGHPSLDRRADRRRPGHRRRAGRRLTLAQPRRPRCPTSTR